MRESLIWGDGYADDEWSEVARVRSWRQISRDECVRLFPALMPADGQIPDAVVAIVAARVQEIEAASRSSEPLQPGSRIFRWLRLRPRDPEAPEATQADAQWLKDVVASSATAELRSDTYDMAKFAYLTGVHPAYVWPAALCLANWGATAAWLGALARFGRAMMPIEVAEYLVDVVAETNGVLVLRDPLLGDFIRRNLRPADLLRAARRRLRRPSVVVRRRPFEARKLAPGATWRRWLEKWRVIRVPPDATGVVGPWSR
jgi:hypothetical protein